MESARELHEKGMTFSEKALEELKVIIRAVTDIVDTSYIVFEDKNQELAKKVEPLEEIIDELNMELKSRHVRRLRKGTCTIEQGFVLSDVLTSLERIADHCSNIAVCVSQVSEDSFDTHSYLHDMKKEENEAFQRRMEETRKQYLFRKRLKMGVREGVKNRNDLLCGRRAQYPGASGIYAGNHWV